MIDNRKEQERAELHRTIWNIANDLRGSVDGWDFKQYVLGFLFYRYISENLTAYINKGEIEAGEIDFDYAQLSDEQAECVRNDMVTMGILLRINRSIQAEGAFGVIKENHKFRQFLLRGNKKVLTEIAVVAMAYNINKLHHKIQDNRTGTQLHGELSA